MSYRVLPEVLFETISLSRMQILLVQMRRAICQHYLSFCYLIFQCNMTTVCRHGGHCSYVMYWRYCASVGTGSSGQTFRPDSTSVSCIESY